MRTIGQLLSDAIARLLRVRIARAGQSTIRDAFPNGSRHIYQEALLDFNIPEGASVLDIGCGPAPFHRATVVCDRFTGDTVHRHGKLATGGLSFVEADVHSLPFGDKQFDFVYCAHVLEHIDDPIGACREIMRVGKRGYLETPNFMKDSLFCYAGIMHHRWHTFAAGNSLFFLEYTPRQLEGIRTVCWRDLIWSRYHHPLQDAFVQNQDIFNTMFLWSAQFDVYVVTAGGSVECWQPAKDGHS